MAESRNETLYQLITSIDAKRQFANLSSATRLFVLEFYRDQFHRQQRVSEQHEMAVQ